MPYPIDERQLMKLKCSVSIAGIFIVGVLASGTAFSQTPSEVGALKTELEELRRQMPDQAHAMADVDYHFANLWFAGQAANWPLAEFYLNETRSHLNWAVRLRPVRKLSSGGELDVGAMLKGIEASVLNDLRAAVNNKDGAAFGAAYRGMIGACHGYHIAAEKPYLRPRIPEAPASRMIDFTPGPRP